MREFAYDKKHPSHPSEEMIGMRIVVSHYYWKINDDVIWATVEKDLPALKIKIVAWRKELEGESGST